MGRKMEALTLYASCQTEHMCIAVKKPGRNGILQDRADESISSLALALTRTPYLMGVFRIKHLSASVNASVFDWLRSRGHAVRPELSRLEREQLQARTPMFYAGLLL